MVALLGGQIDPSKNLCEPQLLGNVERGGVGLARAPDGSLSGFDEAPSYNCCGCGGIAVPAKALTRAYTDVAVLRRACVGMCNPNNPSVDDWGGDHTFQQRGVEVFVPVGAQLFGSRLQ